MLVALENSFNHQGCATVKKTNSAVYVTLAVSITLVVMAVMQLLPLPSRLGVVVVGVRGFGGVYMQERRPEVIPLLKSNKKPHSYF